MNEEKVCCPKFDPAPWDGKFFEWNNKKFIHDKVFTLFFMPINYGAVISRMINKVERAGAKAPDWLCLCDCISQWNTDLFLAVDRDTPDAKNVSISGKFLSKVYEGDFKDTGKWRRDFASYVEGQGLKADKIYMWYTTCPKCAKKYGKNYVVIMAKIK